MLITVTLASLPGPLLEAAGTAGALALGLVLLPVSLGAADLYYHGVERRLTRLANRLLAGPRSGAVPAP